MVNTVETGEMFTAEFFYPHEPFHSWHRNRYIKFGDGVIEVNENITESKKAEEKLRENVQFIQSLTNATADILFVINLHTKEVTYANRQIALVLGYTAAQIETMKQPFFDLMDSRDRPAVLQHFEEMKTAADGEVREIEYRMACANGDTRWYKDRNVVFERDSEGVPFLKSAFRKILPNGKSAKMKFSKTSTC